jgi:Tfp pilus assembly protein PilX
MPARGRDYTRIHRTVVLTVLVVITCVGAASAQDATLHARTAPRGGA